MTDERQDVRALIARGHGTHAPECRTQHGMFEQFCDCDARHESPLSNDLADACEQLLDLVRRLQWGAERCELCGRGPFYGDERREHAPDCPIAALGLPAEDE